MKAAPSLELVVVIDVGNSGAKVGAVRGEDVAGPLRLPRADGRAVRDIAGPMLKGHEAIVAVSGSDPTKVKDLAWEVAKLRLGTCVEVGADHKGIPEALVERPERAGVDRRVQVLGATTLAGGAAVVVSCGSALTIDVGNEDGALLGGAILPGLTMGARALAAGTAKLPKVDLEGAVEMPARDTEAAIRTGILLGAAGAVERLLAEADIDAATPLFLTGQDAALLEPHLARKARVHPGLGVYGVAVAVRASPPR